MNTRAIIGRTAVGLTGMMVIASSSVAADATQTVVLHAGWNAVWLEVTPEPNDIEYVFRPLTDLGVLRGVWRRNDSDQATQFVQNPALLLPKPDTWLTWFPPASGRSVLKTLHAVHGGQCYLVELGPGGAPVQLTMTGRGVTQPLLWQAASYTLTGLSVDPIDPPTFAEFFAPSPAHSGVQISRLDPATGAWVASSAQTTIQRGEAYYIRANAPSTYQGPASVEADERGFLDFGAAVVERPLTLRNDSNVAAQFTVKNLPAATAGGLALSVFDDWSSAGNPNLFAWRELPAGGLAVPVSAGLRRTLRVAIRRKDMTGQGVGTPFGALLDIRTNQGTWHVVCARADGFPPAADPARWAGLWVGHARIFQVEQVTENQTGLKDTASEATIRLIVHVDQGGNAKLLRECILMWLNGTSNAAGEVTEPGRALVFADGEAIDDWKAANTARASRLTGVTQRALGQMVGHRISSVAFSFAGPRPMTGAFGSGELKTTITVAAQDDLNPFRHRYHPDHQQGLPIKRDIILDFSALPGDGGDRPPDIADGDSELAGTYRETIDGLYRAGVGIRGEFRLRRALGKADLYQ